MIFGLKIMFFFFFLQKQTDDCYIKNRTIFWTLAWDIFTFQVKKNLAINWIDVTLIKIWGVYQTIVSKLGCITQFPWFISYLLGSILGSIIYIIIWHKIERLLIVRSGTFLKSINWYTPFFRLMLQLNIHGIKCTYVHGVICTRKNEYWPQLPHQSISFLVHTKSRTPVEESIIV